ncbi:hypothetical protein [Paracidovorax cattleyae]
MTVDLGPHVRLVWAPRLYHAEGTDLAERFTRDVEAAAATCGGTASTRRP